MLPDKIRGYRVQRADVVVAVRTPNEPRPPGKYDLLVTVDPPEAITVGITGSRVDVTGEIESLRHEGDIDFVMFRDFTVNELPVEISEYATKFRLAKQRPFKLTKPITVKIGSLTMARAAATDVLRGTPRLQVNGTLWVFGRFKRFGFGFKRVIPVTLAFSIENTLFD